MYGALTTKKCLVIRCIIMDEFIDGKYRKLYTKCDEHVTGK